MDKPGAAKSGGGELPVDVRESLERLEATGIDGLKAQFGALPDGIQEGETVEHFERHGLLNRSESRVCLDGTRVVLNDGVSEHDYIHASSVLGANGQMEYVCTQGPMSHTAIDFWRMAYQVGSPVVVMLCRVTESNLAKCFQYWPENK